MRIKCTLLPLAVISLLAALFAPALNAQPSPSTASVSAPTEELRMVGSARLRVMFWTIYDSSLYSADGEFDRIEPDLALAITYRRNIPAADLIERTFDEWQEMGVSSSGQSIWRRQLEQLWPDVKSGDTLTLYVDDELASRFYFNDRFIGTMMESDFTEQFLGIWLSEKSDYPRQRAELTGRKD